MADVTESKLSFKPTSINGFNEIISPSRYKINDTITVYNPTLEEIRLYGEENYTHILWIFTRRPYDMAVELFDNGIDYQSITEFQLFFDMANTIPIEVSCILFGRLDFTEYVKTIDQESQMPVLYNPKNGSKIDEVIFQQILSYLRFTNFIPEKVEYDVGNGTAKKFLIDRMRRKQNKRLKDIESGKEKVVSKLYSMISYLVNNKDFKYDYSSVMKLYVCQLYESFYRIVNDCHISNINYGIYSGSIDGSKISKDDLDIMRDLHS